MATYTTYHEVVSLLEKQHTQVDPVWDYTINNWQGYGCFDSKEEAVQVLNFLQAYGDTLEGLHEKIMNGEPFGNYIGAFVSDRDAVDALLCDHRLMCSKEQLDTFLEDLMDREGTISEAERDFCISIINLYRTYNGLVVSL